MSQAQKYLAAVDVLEIAESPNNPRKLFDGPALAELAESIKAQGVLSPVLLRKLEGGEPLYEYELVFGHRRLRAAKLAGLTEIPALLTDMDDHQALEAQVLENAQREDVTPIEEADGYAALRARNGMSIPEIAAKLGKSESHIYQRLKLLDLPEDALKAVASGHLALSVALALARIPNPTLRTQAAAEVLEEKTRTVWDQDAREQVEVRERMTSEQALRHVRNRYSLRLDGCGWDLDDAGLVPDAGACSKCPKRSLNAPMLFPDLASHDDLCTDPDCHASKKEATWQRRKAEEAAAGRVVLDGAAAEKVCCEYGPKPSSGFVQVDTRCWEDSKQRPWGQVLGAKALAKVVVLARDSTGKVHDLIPAEVIAAKKKELAAKAKEDPKERARDEEQERAEFEADVAVETRRVTVARCVEAAELVDTSSSTLWRLAAEVLLSDGPCASDVVLTAQRRGVVPEGGEEDRPAVYLREALRTSMTPAQVRGLVVELLLEQAGACTTWGHGPEVLAAAVEALKVDAKGAAKAARKKVEAARKAEEAKKAEKLAKKAKPAKAAAPIDTCKVCGCTDAEPCEGGCGWVDHTHSVCSACVEAEPGDKPEPKKGKAAPATKLRMGDVVTYQQGPGTFEATVVEVHADVGAVDLERCKDGKRLTRPISKVQKAGR